MRARLPGQAVPQHMGLAYDMWAPVAQSGDDAGKIPTNQREAWFARLANIQLHQNDRPAYQAAYKRWKEALDLQGSATIRVTLKSRLLIGHGNPSAVEVGLTVHHTWGTPILPGSSLKGILHHALTRRYGPEPESWVHHPLDEAHPEPERADFQPAYWRGSRVEHGPGRALSLLFGAPEADSDQAWLSLDEDHPVGARRGALRFHDAWMIPPGEEDLWRPFSKDVLTVHQRGYYNQAGRGRVWPNDYESPNPVGFMAVRPGITFLLAISGEEELATFALEQLKDALETRGVGGKTSAGYGQLCGEGRVKWRVQFDCEALRSLQLFLARKIPKSPDLSNWAGRFEHQFADDLLQVLLRERQIIRNEAIRLIEKRNITSRSVQGVIQDWLRQLRGEIDQGGVEEQIPYLNELELLYEYLKNDDNPENRSESIEEFIYELSENEDQALKDEAVRLLQKQSEKITESCLIDCLELLSGIR